MNEEVLLRPEVDEAMEEALGRAILPHGSCLGKGLQDRQCEVSVWLVCCDEKNIAATQQTAEGKGEGEEPGLYPIAQLIKESPFGAAVELSMSER